MAQKKPTPLPGLLAIKLRMLTEDQVERAVSESESSGDSSLVQVFLEMGLLDREQVAKLRKVQRRESRAACRRPRGPCGRVAGDASR